MSHEFNRQGRFESFEEFWPFYLGEHAHPLCRKLHFIGTSLAIGSAVGAIATGQLWMMGLAPVAGYGFAWAGHFLVEKNRPATFTYPLWSLAGDFRMWWLMLNGEIEAELERHGIKWQPPEERALRAV